ncbi:MAG TPA: DMT family transporter [Mycobacteriales bacterium]|nr:DMT family transporter [Mycobacteriales bacterium]
MLVFLLSFAASLCFAAGFVLQYHEAHEAPDRLFLSPKLLVELAHHKVWLAGIAVMFIGNGLQASALGVGSLAVVEPILTTSLLFALPLSAAWRRERLQRQEWLGAFLVSAGLGVVLGVGSPTTGHSTMSSPMWLLVVLASCGGAQLMVSLGRRSRWPAPRAALIGCAAGVLFGLQDVLTGFCMHDLSHHGWLVTLTSWQFYLLIVIGAYGLVLMQSAYKAGPLTAGLPTIAVGEPVAGMLIGVFALNEQLNASTAAVTVEILAAVVMVLGTWMLGRSPLVCGSHHPSRLRRLEAKLLHDGADLVVPAQSDLPQPNAAPQPAFERSRAPARIG